MRKKVVIIGGGIAGLTAAHELIERGFDVSVYEHRERFGGKAASTSSGGLPGEHGFRFFPGWYQHVPDTMKRIPYGQDQGQQRRTVYENLVPAQTNLFASYNREPISAPVRFPRSWGDFRTALSFPQRVLDLGIPHDDIAFFLGKLLQFAMTPEAEREKEYDSKTWWAFMEADGRSQPFRDYLVDGLTRNTVAANPKQASAYTIGHAALRTLFDVLRPEGIDRVLNGPTSETWIGPWERHLRARGVELITNAELVSIDLDKLRIGQVWVRIGDFNRKQVAAKLEALRLFRRLYGEAGRGARSSTTRESMSRLTGLVLGSSLSDPRELEVRLPELLETALKEWTNTFLAGRGLELEAKLRCNLKEQEPRADHVAAVQSARQWFEATYKSAWHEYEKALAAASPQSVRADYFVFALPVEQMAFYVHRSETLRRLDPKLTNIIPLSDYVAWMAGIQFYLTENQTVTRGHVDCIDSEWRLTALSQTQFWSDFHLSEFRTSSRGSRVKSILSVDISAWDIKGRLLKKEAFACTRQEIAEEVWCQLKRSLNQPNQLPVLYDSMLLGSKSAADGSCVENNGIQLHIPEESYHLDDDIVSRYDRKKQAFYQKFESVHFSAEALCNRQKLQSGASALEATFAFGDRIELNAEPLLVNRVNSLPLRPRASGTISNMFLAADYVRTSTNLATMEAANEAARAAVNEILSRSGSHEKPCRLWQWQPSDVLREIQSLMLYPEGAAALEYAAVPFRIAAGAASKVGELATKALARLTERNK